MSEAVYFKEAGFRLFQSATKAIKTCSIMNEIDCQHFLLEGAHQPSSANIVAGLLCRAKVTTISNVCQKHISSCSSRGLSYLAEPGAF